MTTIHDTPTHTTTTLETQIRAATAPLRELFTHLHNQGIDYDTCTEANRFLQEETMYAYRIAAVPALAAAWGSA